MTRWLPRFALCRWGGGDPDGLFDYDGLCLTIEWLGCIIDLAWGRRVK